MDWIEEPARVACGLITVSAQGSIPGYESVQRVTLRREVETAKNLRDLSTPSPPVHYLSCGWGGAALAMIVKTKLITKIFRKWRKPARLFLVSLVVAPQNRNRSLDMLAILEKDDYEQRVRASFEEVVSLPKVTQRVDNLPTDLGLEIIVVGLRGGMLASLEAGEFIFPIFWRPRVHIKARLSNLENGSTVNSFSGVEKMPWLRFLNSAFRPSTIFGFRATVDSEYIEYMALKCLISVLQRVKSSI